MQTRTGRKFHTIEDVEQMAVTWDDDARREYTAQTLLVAPIANT
ncbi:MAG: hypothetical protein ABI593_00875 [Betaproteobacteria bacterium]